MIIQHWKGVTSRRKDGEQVWSMETAKYCQWKVRWAKSDTILHRMAKRMAQHGRDSETRGFRMTAWDELEKMRQLGDHDALVGQTPQEACPTFTQWAHWSQCDGGRYCSPLVLLALHHGGNR